MSVLQMSFGDAAGTMALGCLDGTVERVDLGRGAWYDLRPSWVAGSDALFAELERDVPWQREERWMYDRVVDVPRLVSFYGEGVQLPSPVLTEARDALTAYYDGEPGGRFVSAGLCLYRDGRDSVAWHGDRIGRGATEDVCVAIVSLGERRGMLLRPRSGGRSIRLELGRGDLFVMGGSCQRTWEHAVPKSTRVTGARVSVQFRPQGTR
jgi:alkylated DNA repair dioxygenase AlkB